MLGLHSATTDELKFLSFVTALENMYLPNIKNELNFRFALRIAHVLDGKITKKNKEELFKLAKKYIMKEVILFMETQKII